MNLIDISRTIHPYMEMYPGDIPPGIEIISGLQQGNSYNISRIFMGTHTGTHVDAPLHVIQGGDGIDMVPLEQLMGPAKVLDLSGKQTQIGPDQIEFDDDDTILLFKGDRSGISATTALFLVECGIKTIGTESLSIGVSEEEFEVHSILLNNNIAIIEGLDLSGVCAGNYFLVCLPLKIRCGDGSPARAVLIDKK